MRTPSQARPLPCGLRRPLRPPRAAAAHDLCASADAGGAAAASWVSPLAASQVRITSCTAGRGGGPHPLREAASAWPRRRASRQRRGGPSWPAVHRPTRRSPHGSRGPGRVQASSVPALRPATEATMAPSPCGARRPGSQRPPAANVQHEGHHARARVTAMFGDSAPFELARRALGSDRGGGHQTDIEVSKIAALIDIPDIETRTLVLSVPMRHPWPDGSGEITITKPRGNRVTHSTVAYHNPPAHLAAACRPPRWQAATCHPRRG